MRPISRQAFEQAVRELSSSTNLTVSSLAKTLGVSRAWLYEKFPEVRELSRRLSDDDVIGEIKRIRAERPTGRITVEEVSQHLGITRQTFSRNFRHLYGYLRPDAEVFGQSSVERRLLLQVGELEKKVRSLTEEKEIALKKKEQEIFSTLMRKDAENFESIKTSSSLKRLQEQAESQAQIAREKAKEVAELRIEIAKMRGREPLYGCDIVNHLKPDYSTISTANGASLKEIIKLFNAAEKQNFAIAEEIIVEQRPEHVILFQPYLSCNRLSIPTLPVRGKVIVVESNVFREDIRNHFVKSICGVPIMAIYAQTSLAKTKLFARGAKIPLSEDFIEKLHGNVMPPVLDDGFSAIVSFDPEEFLGDFIR